MSYSSNREASKKEDGETGIILASSTVCQTRSWKGWVKGVTGRETREGECTCFVFGTFSNVQDKSFAVYNFDIAGYVDGCKWVITSNHDTL
jgi:hypothetical protein